MIEMTEGFSHEFNDLSFMAYSTEEEREVEDNIAARKREDAIAEYEFETASEGAWLKAAEYDPEAQDEMARGY